MNYLDSIGRKQSAEVQKKALIAEARAKAESAVQSASNRRETELSKIDAAISTARADNAKRLADAQTRSAALVAEAQGQVASRWRAPRASSRCRRRASSRCAASWPPTCWSRRAPRKAAAEASAKGDAAQIIEQGRATAAAMSEIAATWREVGPAARSVFLMQKVADLTRIVMSTVKTLKVERLTILGGIGGGGAAAAATARARHRHPRADRPADRRQRADQGRDRDRHRRRPACAHTAAPRADRGRSLRVARCETGVDCFD